jgi:SpoVK/Ycf46/Vps4 family AAA+-type ATPase
MSITSINDVKFNKEDIIFLFDEIDINSKCTNRKSDIKEILVKLSEHKEIHRADIVEIEDLIKKEYDDNLSLSTLLSRFDGIGNYNGVIIVATTNKIDSIDESLRRDMRLTPLEFDFCRREDIINIMEDYLKIKLTMSDLNKITDNVKITPAKLKFLLEKYSKKYEVLLEKLSEYIQQ